jgi:hypothetical protein
MSVAYDNVGPSSSGTAKGPVATGTTAGSTDLTWMHTCGSSPTLALFVGVGVSSEDSTDSKYTVTVTYNGVSMTSLGLVHTNDSTAGFVQLFALLNPATSGNTVDVHVAWSAGPADNLYVEGGSVSFTGVNQTTGWQNVNSNYGYSTSPSVSITSSSGDMVIDAVANGSAISTSNQTLRWNDNFTSNGAGGNAAQSTAAGATSVSMGYSVASDYWGIIGADVIAAGAAFQPDEDFFSPMLPPAADPAVMVFQ